RRPRSACVLAIAGRRARRPGAVGAVRGGRAGRGLVCGEPWCGGRSASRNRAGWTRRQRRLAAPAAPRLAVGSWELRRELVQRTRGDPRAARQLRLLGVLRRGRLLGGGAAVGWPGAAIRWRLRRGRARGG